MGEEFTPRIVGFLCNWCSYAGADLAGATKQKIAIIEKEITTLVAGSPF
jgi:F420-non-reducing hydrogenase iron-sulfur subunit